MNWNLPNKLTAGRILLAVVFFVLLGLYDHGAAWGRWLLNAAFVLYIIAGITDVLDGWVARRWNQATAFGRIVDPFVDKVLVVGAFAMLAGPNFAHGGHASEIEADLPHWLTGGMSTCVQAWMVVAILAREFIVSAIRGYSESRGITFPATVWGKLKMFVQSVAICTALYQVANLDGIAWALATKIAAVWAAVVISVLSGLAYARKAVVLMSGRAERSRDESG